MPKWLDVGTQVINLDYIQKFLVVEVTKDRKGQVVVEKAILRAILKDGEQVNIAAFKNKLDAMSWIRTRLRNNEEKVIQVR
ncbi:MAG: hypothetical protein BWY45_02614 [Euryarchaeota archaeon ADurb.Bin294]|jgi:hypothetical protein|uniref:hypothetical protein n=1 Tax=Methanospirillum sp. TaxID=45200 RepID=UPI0009C79A53|nr:hypothetical protein [Methanospirillum sp.]NLW77578.1 hypothetical protein [Methanomicrobiales archaeon]OQA54356.1 MAG: hypothetical protein BWY45_02614 [Euryarchaeota archaeon ADurb.Bin294]